MYRHLVPLLLGATLAGGCASNGVYGTYGYGVSATVGDPDLVYVSPGLYAVAGYEDPIFYTNGYYWRYYGGGWYRSPYYTGGWQYWRRPPVVISRIERPYERYYRYGGRVHVDNRSVYRDYRRPVYRDSRDYRRPVYRDDRDYRRPVYRDDRGGPVYRDQRDRRPVTRDTRERSRPVTRDTRERSRPDMRERSRPDMRERSRPVSRDTRVGPSPRVDRGPVRRDR